MEKKKPLVSLCIAVYNHERYIRECLEAALAQTYEPLEIVVSDDCSEDRSFDIIEDVVSHYNGPHMVVLNRNPVNLGIGGNVYKKLELAHGEYYINCAGDDISLPNRVEKVVDEWLRSERKLNLIFSNAIIIDADSRDGGLYFMNAPRYCSTLADFVSDNRSRLSKILAPSVWMLGATSSYSREILVGFERMSHKVMQEDGVFSFRALLLGGMKYIDEPLQKYRIHSNSVSYKQNYKSVAKLLSREYYYVKTQLHDAKSRNVQQEVIVELRKNLLIAILKRIVFSIPYLNIFCVKLVKRLNHKRK